MGDVQQSHSTRDCRMMAHDPTVANACFRGNLRTG